MNTDPKCHLVPGTDFIVDGFRLKRKNRGVGGTYFLSHYHGDHYGGLTEKWCAGPIYCSAITARLVHRILGVGIQWLRPLPLERESVVEGVGVTLVDANHCPGSVMLLFRVPAASSAKASAARCILHTGDMRFDPRMIEPPAPSGGEGARELAVA